MIRRSRTGTSDRSASIRRSKGQGVGTALLSSLLQMADEYGPTSYLETDVDRNVPLYETFGFQVIDQETVRRVNNRFMRRGPKAGAS